MKIICVIAALAVLITIPLSVLSAEDGAELYKSKCAACHGDKGEGNAAAKFPAVKGTKKTADQIVTFLMKGESGKTVHANPAAGVAEEQAKAIAAFIKTLK
jgi:mono/diheme cytochrome c family protein